MALTYHNSGFRDYHGKPVPPYARSYWEFQAFTEGSCRLTSAQGRAQTVSAPVLLVLPPGYVHGWSAAAGEHCEIYVFHFDEVAPELAAALGTDPYLSVPLAPPGITRLAELRSQAREMARHPGRLAPITSSLILAELSLMALCAPEHPRETGDALDRRRVRLALAWFESHLHEGPGLEQMAAATHISVPHLRRLFHRVSGESPRTAMARLRFQRIDELLRDQHYTLEEISAQCGFASAAALSRAYRALRGAPPRGRRRVK